MAKKSRYINVSFSLTEKEGYDTHKLIGVSITDDAVPRDADPVAFLRERVLEELDKRTLEPAAAETPRPLVHIEPLEKPAPPPADEPSDVV